MTSLRSVIASLGLVAALVGLAFVVRPSLAATVSVPEAALTILGLIALVEGVRSIQTRRGVEIEQAETADPEERLRTPMPGGDFDRLIGSRGAGSTKVRRRLTDAALAALSITRQESREDAADRVEEGTWTDDPVAAWYLGGPEVPLPPMRVRLRVLFRDWHRFYVGRTVDAIVDVWEED